MAKAKKKTKKNVRRTVKVKLCVCGKSIKTWKECCAKCNLPC